MNALIMRDEKVMDESFERMVLLLLKDKFELDISNGRREGAIEFDDVSEKSRAVEEEVLEMGTENKGERYDYKLSIYDDKGCLGLAVKVALALTELAPQASNRLRRIS